jgi:hypothetical protein
MKNFNNKLIYMEINNEESLLNACDLLHDAYFDLSTMTYNNRERKWLGKFKREFFENPDLIQSRRKFLFFTEHTFPMADTFLSLEQVAKIRINDRARIEIFTFNECRRENGKYVLYFNEAMEMEIKFDGTPRGYLKDTKLLDERGSFLAFGKRIQINTRRC